MHFNSIEPLRLQAQKHRASHTPTLTTRRNPVGHLLLSGTEAKLLLHTEGHDTRPVSDRSGSTNVLGSITVVGQTEGLSPLDVRRLWVLRQAPIVGLDNLLASRKLELRSAKCLVHMAGRGALASHGPLSIVMDGGLDIVTRSVPDRHDDLADLDASSKVQRLTERVAHTRL